MGNGRRKTSSTSNCGKESSISHTWPDGSCMTVVAEFSVTCERSSAYHRNVGNSRKTVNFSLAALEKEMATHSSLLAWRIQRIEEPGGLLQSLTDDKMVSREVAGKMPWTPQNPHVEMTLISASLHSHS